MQKGGNRTIQKYEKRNLGYKITAFHFYHPKTNSIAFDTILVFCCGVPRGWATFKKKSIYICVNRLTKMKKK